MRSSILLPLYIVTLFCAPSIATAQECGSNTRLGSFQSRVPHGFLNSCSTCHADGNFDSPPTSTQFRVDFWGNNEAWSPSLAALDSDGDGVPNGVELQDPSGTWQPGDPDPGSAALVSNPSDPNDVPPATATPQATDTPTSAPTDTATTTPPASTNTPTPIGTSSPTFSPTDTPTEAPTEVPTETPTPNPSAHPTATATFTQSPTPPNTPTETPTEVPTETPTVSPTPTTPTPDPSPHPTATATFTQSPTPPNTPTETPTEVPTETPTETPEVEPAIYFSGFMTTQITEQSGGNLLYFVLPLNVDGTVFEEPGELLWGEIVLSLGADGTYTFAAEIPAGLTPGRYDLPSLVRRRGGSSSQTEENIGPALVVE